MCCSLWFIPQGHLRATMELPYILLVCGVSYFSLSDVYSTDVGGYEFLPCSDPGMLPSSRCMLHEDEVDKECDCKSLCDDDGRCVFVFYNPETKTCRLYGEEIETTGWKCARIVDCGVPAVGSSMVVTAYTRTTYGSVAEIECALGYFSTTKDMQSVCQDTGQWSDPTGVCEAIPSLRGTDELRDSDDRLECRNVISQQADGKRTRQYALCAEDEILTGCSSTSSLGSEIRGVAITDSQCFVRGKGDFSGFQAVARCCKLPGLRCEYIRNVNVTGSVSCYKDFRLFDCTCKRKTYSTGPCPIKMNNNSCVNPTQFAEFRAFRRAMCCDLGDYSCYRKELTGNDAYDGDLLKIRCDDAGEVMTSCSGYSYGYGVFSSLIKNGTGTDECQLDPGQGDISELYGYITCCKRNQ